MNVPASVIVTDQLVAHVADRLHDVWPFVLNDGIQHEVAREALQCAVTSVEGAFPAPHDDVIDWADPSEWLAGLDDTQRSVLDAALRAAASAENERYIVDIVREGVAQGHDSGEVVAVVFGVSQWPNGFFLTCDGSVLHADGTQRREEFDDLEAIFTDEYGVRGPDFALAVDLRTGRVLTSDCAETLTTLLTHPTVAACGPDDRKEPPA